VVGMWRKDLGLQLCWYNRRLPPPWWGQRVFPYRAPTWSWASLDCSIKMWGEHEQRWQRSEGIWIKVLDVQLQTLDSDPFGQLSMAQLRLSCLYLVDVCIKTTTTKRSVLEEVGKGVLIIGGESLYCQILFDCLGEDENCKFQKAKAMPVFMTSGFGATGLLLEPTGEERGQYERIGWFGFLELEASEAFESNMVKPSYQVPEEECLQIQKDENGKTQRVITLV
jgi:hypothetical protein